MSIDAKVDAELPEGTVVITDISQLSKESQEIFTHFGWDKAEDPFKEYQSIHFRATTSSQRFKRDGNGLLVKNREGTGYVTEDPEVVLRDKAKRGEDGITPEILLQYFGALAIRYLEPLDKKAPVSIGGTSNEAWGFFPAPRNKMGQTFFKLFAKNYVDGALGTFAQPQYASKQG